MRIQTLMGQCNTTQDRVSRVPDSKEAGGKKRAYVYLNVYDLGFFNATYRRIGLGVYHTGVQVYNKEYSFAGQAGNHVRKSGIRVSRPRDISWMKHGYFRMTILVGTTNLSEEEVMCSI
mmetsp:Transcript_21437/g.34677  ORF Transcript_21437/g.34677 Transcript_21437/m.34677 type:complete len:119 (+) Transcript_21437:18-374(+)